MHFAACDELAYSSSSDRRDGAGVAVLVTSSARVVRQRQRSRRPDRMRRACTLLACGWNFQRWGAEGFTSMVGGGCAGGGGGWTSSGTSQRSRTTRTCSAAMMGWQRRPPRRVLGDCCGRVSGLPRQVKAASTLDRHEDGSYVDESNSHESSSGDSSSTSKRSNNGNGRRKPNNISTDGTSKILELLNGLEGGAGGEVEPSEVFGNPAAAEMDLGGAGSSMWDDEESTDASVDENKEEEGDAPPRGGNDTSSSGEERLTAADGEREHRQPYTRRRLRRRVRGPVAPLTRSEAEEERYEQTKPSPDLCI